MKRRRPVVSSDRDLLQRQLSWTLAALDLCLDMERNEADGAFSTSNSHREIVYTFDEDVFELFVSGMNEFQTIGPSDTQIYRDRRQSVGVFNTHQWRKKDISRSEEESRVLINRQSMILTGEYIFGSPLPGMQDNRIFMSRQHLSELNYRWEFLIEFYRSLMSECGGCPEEREKIASLDEDLAFKTLSDPDMCVSSEDTETYIRSQSPILRDDLADLRTAFRKSENEPQTPDETLSRDFWSYAFSRRLAEELAKLRVTQPFGQLRRIHSELSPRLEFLHTVAELDEPKANEKPRLSETPAFWLKKIRARAEARSPYNRSEAALKNDAQTLALVQTFANAAVESNQRRFVFVTSDAVLIDAYREWHCTEALETEPFVVRSIRQYAPLLNIHDMGDGDGSREIALKRDIFKSLRDAIEPLLLKLNLSATSEVNLELKKRSAAIPRVQEDTVRRSREQFSLRLRKVLEQMSPSSGRGGTEPTLSRDELMNAVLHLSIFNDPTAELTEIDRELEAIAERGRGIERAAIGFGSPWLSARLNALKPIQELQQKIAAGDESALARFVTEMVEEFADASLTMRVKFFDTTAELESVPEMTRRAARRRVPLLLRLFFERTGTTVDLATEALQRIDRARPRDERGARTPTFRQKQESDWAVDAGGYRLFALYCCIALYLEKWDTAFRCAVNARRRGRSAPKHERDELDYLLALSIRFRIGAGPIRDAGQSDVTVREYLTVEEMLNTNLQKGLDGFTAYRAAAELTSLQLFSCAWALGSANASPDGRQPSGFDLKFGADRLLSACKCLSALWPHVADAEGDDLVQLRRHAAINVAAAECFAEAFKKLGSPEIVVKCREEIGGILNEALLAALVREWEHAPGWRPRIGSTFFGWVRHLRGWGPAPKRSVGRDLALRVDRRVAALLEALLRAG